MERITKSLRRLWVDYFRFGVDSESILGRLRTREMCLPPDTIPRITIPITPQSADTCAPSTMRCALKLQRSIGAAAVAVFHQVGPVLERSLEAHGRNLRCFFNLEPTRPHQTVANATRPYYQTLPDPETTQRISSEAAQIRFGIVPESN